MNYCADCEKPTYTMWGKYNTYLCDECYEKRCQKELDKKSKSLTETADFKEWKNSDMSELFWMNLGKYVKEPNERSLEIIYMAYMWACHDNHGLANSFSHALKWAKIDLVKERNKWKNLKKENK